MGRYKKLVTFITLAVMVMGLSIVASAQGRNNRNNRGNNNGYYGNTNLNSTIRNLRDHADRFQDVLDRELDQSRYDGTQREDRLNDLAKNFKEAAHRLDDEYDNARDHNQSRDEVSHLLSTGHHLGNALRQSRAARNSNIQTYWRSIESDLSIIARAYNIGYNSGYGNGNYGGNNPYGNGRNDPYGNNRNDRNNGNNGRYNQNLRATIVNLRNKSRNFENLIDRETSNNRYGRRNNNNLEQLTNRFNNAVKKLEDEYDNRRDYNDSINEARQVLNYGEQVDREISNSGLDRNLRRDWNSIEQDLRTLANAFNISYNGRNNNRGYGVGDIIRNFPF